MWFRNIRAYRLTSPFNLSAEQLAERLASHPFQPCGKTQALALGFVSPLGGESESLVHAASGRLLICLRREEKLLPSTVVREQLTEKIAAIEKEQGRKVYRKERLDLKDEIVRDCLPRAFTRSGQLYAFIDTRASWIFVDAASANRAEELLNLLRECVGNLPVLLPQVQQSPAAVMTSWLAKRKLPEDFVCGTECELRELGEEGGVVRCRGVDLFSEEVDSHLQAGRQVVRLTLGWDERLSVQLGEDLCLRRLKFADQLVKENDSIAEDDQAARFDADFALMADAVSALQARLIDVFGGEAG